MLTRRVSQSPWTLTFDLLLIVLMFSGSLYLEKVPSTSATSYFSLLPPGSKLPSESDCAARVRRSSWEPRPQNAAANSRVPTSQEISTLLLGDMNNPQANSLKQQMTGNFTGTTDEIIQWVACKWGLDEDMVRAQAVQETDWYQSQLGDKTTDRSLCPPGSGYPGAWNGSSCYQSYGILQIKYIYNTSAWPMSRDDTAFAVEYMEGIMRYCYEGWATYLGNGYHAGDIWGCIGRWYSGKWYDQAAMAYINSVKNYYATKPWLSPGF